MRNISASLRRFVINRAGNRCEYCGLSQAGQEATFHIDHVIPVKEDGPTVAENLALACVSCSLSKSARRFVVDRHTQREVILFNPRTDCWADHFYWDEVRVIGRTATGRATIDALRMNRLLILEIRQEEAVRGRHPPPQIM